MRSTLKGETTVAGAFAGVPAFVAAVSGAAVSGAAVSVAAVSPIPDVLSLPSLTPPPLLGESPWPESFRTDVADFNIEDDEADESALLVFAPPPSLLVKGATLLLAISPPSPPSTPPPLPPPPSMPR